jgi:aminoglycoside phosphotransferase (APT) family kinase protein
MSSPGMTSPAVVETLEQAAGLDLPPLLVLRPVEAFLDAHGLGSGPVVGEPIGEGHSNVTYLLRRDGADLVLRRPPRPPFAPSAHQVLREARLLRALAGTHVPVPRVLAACDDDGVIGAPFYVMQRLDGHVVTDTVPEELDRPADRRRMGEELVDALVDLHATDWVAAGLEGFGRPVGYLERQLRRFASLWEANRTREIPSLDLVTEWLGSRRPKSGYATLVHGDYRLGNAMFAPGPPARVTAILDWEMATIGDPLADLGYLLAWWAQPGEAPDEVFWLPTVTTRPGFCTRAELAARYGEASGRSPDDLRWYVVLALWKTAIFLEGSYRRLLAGTTDDAFFAELGEHVPALADRALAVARGERDALGGVQC